MDSKAERRTDDKGGTKKYPIMQRTSADLLHVRQSLCAAAELQYIILPERVEKEISR